MATLISPYTTGMRLGNGFNSFTQELCIDNAVIRHDEDDYHKPTDTVLSNTPQVITYKASIIESVTDVTSAVNISAAYLIKHDSFNPKIDVDVLNTFKVNESDVSFLVSVKVVNQISQDLSLTKFNPIAGLKENRFIEVYGDSFISGFQYGGVFTAVISVKGKGKEDSESIKAKARILFTKDKLDFFQDDKPDEERNAFLAENETGISVIQTGGGWRLKNGNADWTFDSVKVAARSFPISVANYHTRTHAILTKYSSLRSYYAANTSASLPDFEHAGVYALLLQEAYLNYKSIAKNLQVLVYGVLAGTQTLKKADVPSYMQGWTREYSTVGSEENPVPGSNLARDNHANSPLSVKESYPPTLQGVENARLMVQQTLQRIVQEVDLISRMPELATREGRELPYMSPLLFKHFLPIGELVPKTTAANLATAVETDSSANQ